MPPFLSSDGEHLYPTLWVHKNRTGKEKDDYNSIHHCSNVNIFTIINPYLRMLRNAVWGTKY